MGREADVGCGGRAGEERDERSAAGRMKPANLSGLRPFFQRFNRTLQAFGLPAVTSAAHEAGVDDPAAPGPWPRVRHPSHDRAGGKVTAARSRRPRKGQVDARRPRRGTGSARLPSRHRTRDAAHGAVRCKEAARGPQRRSGGHSRRVTSRLPFARAASRDPRPVTRDPRPASCTAAPTRAAGPAPGSPCRAGRSAPRSWRSRRSGYRSRCCRCRCPGSRCAP